MTSPAATRATTPAIALSGVSKTYRGGLRAVDDLTVTVPPGQVIGLLGPNGAGKTTTIKMIAGLIEPTGGRIRLNGFDIAAQRGQAVRQIGAATERPLPNEGAAARQRGRRKRVERTPRSSAVPNA